MRLLPLNLLPSLNAQSEPCHSRTSDCPWEPLNPVSRISCTICMASYGAKLTLVNSVTSIAVYAMCSMVSSDCRQRLLGTWTGSEDFASGKRTDRDTDNSLAAWSMVCKPKDKGGLGILDISTLNTVLLMKFLDKFYNHHDLPWVHLIWDTYYLDKIPHVVGQCGSFWWRQILQLRPLLWGISSVRIEDRKFTLFWKDQWCTGIFAKSHPRALSFAIREDAFVHNMLCVEALDDAFHLPLSIQARDEVRDLQNISSDQQVDVHTHDTWTYAWGPKYTSSRHYKFFREITADQAYRWIWKLRCTMKIKVFLWLLLSD